MSLQFEQAQTLQELIQFRSQLTKKNSILQFHLDELTFKDEEITQTRTNLIIQNQQLVHSTSQLEHDIEECSQNIEYLKLQCQNIGLQKAELKSKTQRVRDQIRLHELKKKKGRQLIHVETDRKIKLAVDCEEMVQKTQSIYNQIQNLKQVRRDAQTQFQKQCETTQHLRRILQELKEIYQRGNKRT